MKPNQILVLVISVAVAAGAGWFAAKRSGDSHEQHNHAAPVAPANGKIYSCSMHPQIRSDKLIKCTICQMALAPIGAGSQADVPEGVVPLSFAVIQVINVQTEEVVRRTLSRTLRVAGMIDDDDTRHRRLSAYVEGRVEKLFVNYVGAEVVAGQPLAMIYSPTLYNAEREYLLLLRQSVPTNFPILATEHERALNAVTLRLKRLGLSDEQVDKLGQKAAADYRSELLAPMSGTVVTREVYEGQYVKEGDKLFEVADFSRMWFKFDAYERDLVWLKPGQSIEVTAPALPGRVFTNTIAFIDPNVADMSRSAKVRVELENPLVDRNGRRQRELLHKLYAEGVVRVEVPESLAVPRSAVLQPGAQAVAYVDKGGGHYEQRKLKLGRRGDDAWEVLDGLKAGDRVVTHGNLLIDAQAELSRSGSSHEHAHGASAKGAIKPTPVADLPPLTEPQQKAAGEFFAVMDALAVALAGDKVDEFNKHAARIHPALTQLVPAFRDVKEAEAVMKRITASGHLAPAKKLEAARAAFLPVSLATADFAKALRKQPPFKSVKVYHCPMVDRVVEGAAKDGYWIQLRAGLKNPFFGADMLECGEEVKP